MPRSALLAIRNLLSTYPRDARLTERIPATAGSTLRNADLSPRDGCRPRQVPHCATRGRPIRATRRAAQPTDGRRQVPHCATRGRRIRATRRAAQPTDGRRQVPHCATRGRRIRATRRAAQPTDGRRQGPHCATAAGVSARRDARRNRRMGDGRCHIAQPLPAYPRDATRGATDGWATASATLRNPRPTHPRDATRGEREARWAEPNEGKRESFPLNSPPTRAT